MIFSFRWTPAAAAIAVILALAGCGGRDEQKVAGEAGQRVPVQTEVNLVVNPGMEKWDGFRPAGWDFKTIKGGGSNASFVGKSDKTRSGGSSVYVRGTFTTDNWMALSQRLPAYPGYEIVASADIMTEGIKKAEGQDDIDGVYIRFYDAEGNRVNDRYFFDARTETRIGTQGWSRETVKEMTPDRAYEMEIGLVNLMSGYMYFDNVSLVVKEKVDWKEEKTKFITFKWLDQRPFPRDALEKERKMVEEVAAEVGIDKIEGTITYYLYPDEETYMKILGRTRYRTAARWDRKELHTIDTWNDHEMIHLILYDLGFPPFGLAKGLVYHFREKYNNWDLDVRSKRFLMQMKMPALYKTIEAKTWQSQDHSIVVPAWGSFVDYLIDEYGMDKMVELFVKSNGVEEAEPFNVIFREIYGQDFQEMDRAWRLYLMRHEYDAAADTLPDL